jgi:hypothetical protein
MGRTISGLVAAVAVMTSGAAPATACGLFDTCSPCGTAYISPCVQTYAPAYTYTGCNSGCGWDFERLAEPTTQYYYVNQGPTYTGPGAFAPYPTYRESAVSYHRHHHYARHHPYRYGYAPRYGRHVLCCYY